MRADFIANASHELRTPLAAISGFVETLRGPARDDAAARDRFLQIMQEQTARMARLIEDLLSLSRLEMKAPAPPGQRVELAAVVEGVVETLRALALDSGVEIDNLFGATPVEIPGERDELFQVFQNLVENACKYGRAGGRVEIARIVGDAREIGVEVRDFGPGIAAEHIPRITERFYRIDAESSRLQKGTGLGLSIVKHIVSRHRGRLVIASEPGKGAAFTVYLPAG
jgi:two-component system phosphate regulon sensor histidine kinase PhoR